MKTASVAEVKDQLSRFLKEAAQENIVITRHGKPAAVLVGFESEDDWLDYRLEHDPQFLKKIAEARVSLRAGKGIPWDKVENDEPRRTIVSRRRSGRHNTSR